MPPSGGYMKLQGMTFKKKLKKGVATMLKINQ